MVLYICKIILDGGIYMKKIISFLLSVLMIFSITTVAFAANEDTAIKAYSYGGSDDIQAYKSKIETLTFTGVAVKANAVNAGKAWDISSAGNSSVTAWLEDADSNGLFEAYITADGKDIYANANSAFLFEGYSALKSINGIRYFKTDNVISMESMFMNCSSLEIIDVQYFNTGNVTTMKSMFENCKALTTIIGIDNFNTSNVILMDKMFFGCESLVNLDLTDFDTLKVTNMSYMFYNCKKLEVCEFGYVNSKEGTDYMRDGRISKFNTQNVTDMSYMFSGCTALSDLNLCGFNTGNVSSVQKMFYGCSNLVTLDLSNWNFTNLGGKNQAIYEFVSACPNLKKLYLYDIEGYNAEFHDFEENFVGTSAVKIYTQDPAFEQYTLWKNVLKYMSGSSISYINIPNGKAILTFTIPNGVSYYCVSVIGSGENDYVFYDETRSFSRNTKVMITLYGDYTEYKFYVDGVEKTIKEDEAIYLNVVDDAAIYAVGVGDPFGTVDDADKDTVEGTDTATNFFGVFSILFNRIIAFFKNLFGIK